MVQYILDSANPVILDCIFQHIPLEMCMTQGLKKKDGDLPPEASAAASAAKHVITTGSLLFSIESLWPVESLKLAPLAGALYGLILCVLPAYVRGWFSDLRDRYTSSLVESFTRTWCSPPLIANELSQVRLDQNKKVNSSSLLIYKPLSQQIICFRIVNLYSLSS